MPDPQPTNSAREAIAQERLGYFMVRIRRSAGDPPGEFAGIVERLGTGEKRAIRNSGELAQVVEEWSL